MLSNICLLLHATFFNKKGRISQIKGFFSVEILE